MTVVLAAVPPRRPLLELVDDELLEALGAAGVQHLDHLMDGRPVVVPALFAGPWPIDDRRRSPRVRFVVGEIRRHPTTGGWCGPVLIDTASGVPAYLQPAYLAHEDCVPCARVWSDRSAEVVAAGGGHELFRTGLMPGADGPLEVLTHTRDLAPRQAPPRPSTPRPVAVRPGAGRAGAPRLTDQTIMVPSPAGTRLVAPACPGAARRPGA